MINRDQLKSFIDRLDRDAVAARACQISKSDSSTETFRTQLDTFLNEAQVGLDLIAPNLSPGARILELGCGVGVLTAFLIEKGFQVVGIEPGAQEEFGFMPAISQAIAEALPVKSRPTILPIGAEKLSAQDHGKFDLIFSVNVIEHISQLDLALKSMAEVLTTEGRMMHVCPNYSFPYEPHLAIPLVPVVPSLTKYFLPNVIRRHQQMWNTLNFVTVGQIRSLADRHQLKVDFESGVMGRFFERIRHDQLFSSRHSGLVGWMARSKLTGSIISAFLSALPVTLATPMVFTLKHRN